MCVNFHSRNYTALQYTEQFAVPSWPVGCLHLLKVYIFLVLLPVNYLIIFTLLRCNHITVLKGAPKCA